MTYFDEFHDLVQKENPETIAKFYEQFFTNKVAPIRTIIKMAEKKKVLRSQQKKYKTMPEQ